MIPGEKGNQIHRNIEMALLYALSPSSAGIGKNSEFQGMEVLTGCYFSSFELCPLPLPQYFLNTLIIL